MFDITIWFMIFGAKRTTPVVWTEIQFKFWHWVPTLQATAAQPGPLFTPFSHFKSTLIWGLRRPPLVKFTYRSFIRLTILAATLHLRYTWDLKMPWPLAFDFVLFRGQLLKMQRAVPISAFSVLATCLASHTTLVYLLENQNQTTGIIQEKEKEKECR